MKLLRPIRIALCLGFAYALTFVSPAAAGEIVGLWHFDGNVTDSSGYGSTANQWGHILFDFETKQVGTASVHIDQSEVQSGIRLNLSPEAAALKGKTEIGFSVWIYRNRDDAGNQRVLAFSDHANASPTFRLQRSAAWPNNPNRYLLQAPGLNLPSGSTNSPQIILPFREWTHFAIASDGTHAGVYVNGERIGPLAEVGTAGFEAGAYLQLGMEASNVGNRSDVFFDDLVLYDGPADADWVAHLYQLGLQGINAFIPEREPDEPVPVAIRQAGELEFATEVGSVYLVQSSDDGETWTNEGTMFVADGEITRRFVSGDRQFYRVRTQ